MIIPDEVLLGPFRYRVAYVENLRGEQDRNAWLFGEVNYIEKVIRLRAGNDPEQMVSTFLHECLHVLDQQVYKIGLSEKNVKRLGVALAALLIDNNLLAPDPEPEPKGDGPPVPEPPDDQAPASVVPIRGAA